MVLILDPDCRLDPHGRQYKLNALLDEPGQDVLFPGFHSPTLCESPPSPLSPLLPQHRPGKIRIHGIFRETEVFWPDVSCNGPSRGKPYIDGVLGWRSWSVIWRGVIFRQRRIRRQQGQALRLLVNGDGRASRRAFRERTHQAEAALPGGYQAYEQGASRSQVALDCRQPNRLLRHGPALFCSEINTGYRPGLRVDEGPKVQGDICVALGERV